MSAVRSTSTGIVLAVLPGQRTGGRSSYTAGTTVLPLPGWPAPCLVSPGRGLVHQDGACRCFADGERPTSR